MRLGLCLFLLLVACEDSKESEQQSPAVSGTSGEIQQLSAPDSMKLADGKLQSFLDRNADFYLDTASYSQPIWIDDETLVYLDSEDSADGMQHVYTIYRYNIGTKEKKSLWEKETPYSPSLLKYRPSDHALLFAVTVDENRTQTLQLNANSGELAAYPQEKHGDWTMTFRPDGIWGENAASGKSVQWAKSTGRMTPEIYFLQDGKSFVFLEETGRRFADGSGIERNLRKVDMETGRVTTLFPDQPQWDILGWAKEGEILLVDVAFNEGASQDYSYPILMDLVQETSKPLIPDQANFSSYYDGIFSEEAGLFITHTDGQRYMFNMQGELITKHAWHGEFQRKEAFSPDGLRTAFTSGTFQEGKIFVGDADGEHVSAMTSDSMPVSALIWSPSGKRLLVQIDGHLMIAVDVYKSNQ
ncbi:TolB family protein [Paenibacillus spongiae]|uniref:WD40 repeat domain-containing protein n=1 Tax=Paenibacillus spongiae TaxID=2909671 RepID=A0ABY5S9D4_9BACL|nr:hypothetical protein [Paenibacillus spongiae]UVI30521.1 hypothetical protein L1F29_01105 [Paenibacillus spongiae]